MTSVRGNPVFKDLMRRDEEALAAKIGGMVERIVERFDPDQIILFGSRARGTTRPDSDVDLLVVMPVTGSKHEKQVELRCMLHDIRVAKDIIVATPDEVERRRNVVGTIRPGTAYHSILCTTLFKASVQWAH